MRIVLLLLLALMLPASLAQSLSSQTENSPTTVLSFKCYRDRQQVQYSEPVYTGPAESMSALNTVRAREARANDPKGANDPNSQTTEGRAQALEKTVEESRTPRKEAVDGYSFRVKVLNSGSKTIDIVFWEYQFIDPSEPSNTARRQFLCGVKLKPGKEAELQAFGVHGPSDVINVGSLNKKSANPYEEKVVINRVEYTDGTSFTRKGWNSLEIKESYKHALATPWGSEMCRPL